MKPRTINAENDRAILGVYVAHISNNILWSIVTVDENVLLHVEVQVPAIRHQSEIFWATSSTMSLLSKSERWGSTPLSWCTSMLDTSSRGRRIKMGEYPPISAHEYVKVNIQPGAVRARLEASVIRSQRKGEAPTAMQSICAPKFEKKALFRDTQHRENKGLAEYPILPGNGGRYSHLKPLHPGQWMILSRSVQSTVSAIASTIAIDNRFHTVCGTLTI